MLSSHPFDPLDLERPGIGLPSQVSLEKRKIDLGVVWIHCVLHSFQLSTFSLRIQLLEMSQSNSLYVPGPGVMQDMI